MAARNSINTRGVVGVIIVPAVFMDRINEKTKDLFNKYVDIIVVLLGISLLCVWGTFARIGRTEANLCHAMEDDTSRWYLSIMIMVGATFGLYGALKHKLKDETPTHKKNLTLGVLFVMHAATLLVTWVVYFDVIDFARGENTSCDEFFGQQHMFLNVAFVGLIISAMYVWYALCASFKGWGQIAGHAVLYAGITFIFFFYASADSDDTTSFWDDKTQLAWTWSTSGVVLAYNIYVGWHNEQNRKNDVKDRISLLPRKDPVQIDASHFWSRLVAFVALAVVGTNIGLATSVLQADVDSLAHSGVVGTGSENDLHKNPNNSTSGCLGEDHDDVLSMGITVVGYWAIYILILCMAFVQYTVQLATTGMTDACRYTIRIPFTSIDVKGNYRDKYDGMNMPTVLVTVTYLWLLAGGIEHFSKIDDKDCGNNKHYELVMFIFHTLGVVAVLFVFPLLIAGDNGGRIGKRNTARQDDSASLVAASQTDSAAVLRPTNRFTTRAQVAVDVNTPLNFA